MSTHQSTPDATWTGTSSCPFCGTDIDDPGAGFIDHIDESTDCERGFDEWRGRIAGDMKAGWSG